METVLGNPEDRCLEFGYARLAALDHSGEFPHDVCRHLDELGLGRYYVPAPHGGLLTSYETTAHMVRMLARRDMGVAVAHAKTYLGAVCVWLAGNRSQAASLGRMITAGVPVSWGLTERDHGSDLAGGELVAEKTGTSYRLRGEKWPINNATRCGVMCVLARTDPRGGPRGFSLFLVDKSTLLGSYRCLPKVRTLGNRCADVSGIVFCDAEVPADTLIGPEGSGLETVLKGLQVTRTLCSALSLGSSDHALRIAVDFLEKNSRNGRPDIDLRRARRTIALAYADHLLSEALSVVAVRAVHTLTSELAVIAAVAKYLVPTRTEAAIARLRRFMGPAALYQEGRRRGCLGKVERDHRVVSLFDGNTVVNLHSLISMFSLLARARDKRLAPDHEGLAACCELSRPIPRAELGKLALIPRSGASFLLAAESSISQVTALANDNALLMPLATTAQRLGEALDKLWMDIAEEPLSGTDISNHLFSVAKRSALYFAGAVAIELWLRNHQEVPARRPAGRPRRAEDLLWRNGVWLHAALHRILTTTGDQRGGVATPPFDLLFDVLADQVRNEQLPSLFGFQLAEATAAGTPNSYGKVS
ncbi:acyl-CoA dehydrogenase family protein [Amycolatopsis sp. EV170708-02-1]|uniref:acyl-CoA dehydrogenase family protein n=1 Tax=Amycolatopsis sp. EV170708-02-1 TaxID=2919322 RepID=UPI001F0B9131|nr:acyl-CoA dehydrogenase family protein [Amycolatopsis sp. EV170708-02-1]UMP06811.1 acyl-CoA dehydrogenase family protein [Amycolatopsis sp. EV170708-02-1]